MATLNSTLELMEDVGRIGSKKFLKDGTTLNPGRYVFGDGTQEGAIRDLLNIPEVYKTVFVVDRKDLDFQTTKEFNSFSDWSVDGTDNTKALVKQFGDDTKLIVTTIQKLNNAIGVNRYEKIMSELKDKRIVFIFD